jgi:hypothetical protein
VCIIPSDNTGQCTDPADCGTQPTEFPCLCNTNTTICLSGEVCDGNSCILPQLCPDSANPTTMPCICGPETCAVGQYCSPTGGCLDGIRECPSSGATLDPCICGRLATITMCSAGQTCTAANPPGQQCIPELCEGDAPLEGCVCGGTERCVLGQTCTNRTCTPPRCIASTSPTLYSCVCGDGGYDAMADLCNPGERCVLGNPVGMQATDDECLVEGI